MVQEPPIRSDYFYQEGLRMIHNNRRMQDTKLPLVRISTFSGGLCYLPDSLKRNTITESTQHKRKYSKRGDPEPKVRFWKLYPESEETAPVLG